MNCLINFGEATIEGDVNIKHGPDADAVSGLGEETDEVAYDTDQATPRYESTPSKRVHQTTHDWDTDESIMTTLAMSLASIEGVNPKNPNADLYEWVDPDEIDSCIRHLRNSKSVFSIRFEVDGYSVTIQKDGQITIVETE